MSNDRADIESPLRDTDPLLWNALRAASLFDSIDISVLDDEAGRSQALMSGKRLAKFIYREYPDDDDDPITEAWVATFSQSNMNATTYVVGAKDGLNLYVQVDGIGDAHAEIEQLNESIQMPICTRGDLRRLCNGLKIELKESS